MERKDEVAEEYLSSLADLNINSKPLINMLTILAEENIEYASVIVDAVEHHISKVNPDIKLPVLYLIDSIVKNVGRNYITLFGQRIVDIFCGVFAKVDEKVREKMYTLRQTWNDVFPIQKLLALDCQVNRLDRNWPITAKISIATGVAKSPAIHVNPNFLKNQTEPIGDMQAKLRDKQRQLLELQKRKLELELAATKQRLEEQEKQLSMQTEAVKSITLPVVVPPIITVSEPSKQMLNAYNRPQQPKQPSGIIMANNLAAGVANQNASKVRIAPVSQNMLNTLRYRDPRLARQQLQQQQQSQTADTVVSNTVTKAQNSILKPAQHTQISSSTAINELKESVRKEPSHSDPRRSDDKTGNDKSNSNRSNLNSRSSSYQGDKDRSRSSSSSTSSGSNNSGVRKQRESYEKSDKSPRSKSSGRNSSSTKSSSSPGSKSTEKESKIKDKSSSSATKSDDKKKSSSKNASPTRSSGSDKSPSKIERSPKKISSDSPKRTGVSSPSDSQIKFKDLKQSTKSRNYVKRDREKCESPSFLTEKPQDIDLRSGPIPDKRLKLDEQATTINCISNSSNSSISSSILTNSIVTTTPVATIATTTATTTSKSKDLEKNLEAVKSNKDVDLRQFPTTVNTNNKSSNLMGGTAVTSILINKIDTKLDGGKFSPILLSNDKCSSSSDDKFEMVMDVDSTKKRQSGSKLDEPISKKIKSQSEKIDDLFGKEDVDLRNLSGVPPHLTSTVGVSGGVMPMTPPPPPVISNESENWAKVKGSKSNKVSPSSVSSFDDVRAKLAKATKSHLQKINVNEKNRDNKKNRFSDVNEDSSDGTDANIRTIISQAQELLASENINLEQYNTLVKTVIQINETNKLKEAQRRESLQNNTPTKSPQNKVNTSPTQSQASKDSEIKQRDDEEEAHTSILKAKSKALQKRIPKLPKDAPTAEVNIEQNSVLQRTSPPISTNSNYSDNRINAVNVKQDKRICGRQKDSKWPSPWEQAGQNHPNHQNHQNQNQNQNQNKPWIPPMGANMNRLQFNPKVLPPNHPPMIQIAPQNRMQLPNPWNNPPPMIFAGAAMPMPQIIPPTAATADNSIVPIKQFCNSVDNPKDDVVRSINIDSVAKEIRIYDEVAIVFMDWDQPREIGFQNGQRRIIIDDQEPITLNFNDIYTTVIIAGKPHRIRFGCPSRELYIDDNWYECCFGGPPMAIPVDGKMSIIKIEGPPPQVNIGNLRQDLVAGKINLVIDARILVPIFLDAKIQRFELDGKKHTLQFADCLKTVLIDGEALNVEYGGLPRSLFLGGVKYFVRFGTLPNGIIPGKHFIKDMIRTENFPPPLPTPAALNAIKPPVSNPIVTSALTVASVPDIKATSVSSVLPVLTTTTANLPCIQTDIKTSNLITTPATTTTSTTETNVITTQNTVEPCSKVVIPTTTGTITEQIKPPQPILPPVANLNIDELFQKLLASGILNQNVTNAVASQDPNSKKQKEEDVILPIDLSKSETIKTRQAGIVQKLFSGMQCSSCGVRFPPEQTMKYSQHLDWHFRQNRRERDSSRKAHSRKWYYDVSDWIQYEEIEDIDEREKNWFEAQQSELDNPDDNSNPTINSPSPSCPAGPDDVDRACDMCHDKFEQFYNEESEEWHLRSAIRVEDKIYHPLCYQDYKASLKMEEETLPGIEIAENDNAVDIVVIVKEEKTDDDKKSDVIVEDDDDDDDVIVLPTEEPLITEIPSDDDDEEYAAANKSVLSANNPDTNDTTEQSTEISVNVTDENKTENKDSDTAAAADNETNPNDSVESDVEIQEPHIPFTDLDTYEEPPASLSTFDDSSQQSASQFNVIKIKEEPKDSDNEDDVFEDVGTFVSVDEISENVDEYVPQTVSSAPSSDLVASIDGNVEIQDTHVSTTNIGVNKIRINITKNTTTTASSMTGVSNIPTITTSASNNITVTLSSNNNQVEKPQHIPVIESGSAIPVICNFNKDTSNFVINLNKRDDKKNQSPIPDKDKSQLLSKNDRSNTNTNTNTNNSSGSGSGGVSSSDGGSGTKGNSKDNSKNDGGNGNNRADIDDGSSIKYDLKPPLRGVELKKTPKVDSGFETSGLCSIM